MSLSQTFKRWDYKCVPPCQVISHYNFNIINNKTNKEKICWGNASLRCQMGITRHCCFCVLAPKALHSYQTLPNVIRVKLSLSGLMGYRKEEGWWVFKSNHRVRCRNKAKCTIVKIITATGYSFFTNQRIWCMYFSSSKLPTRNMHGIKAQRKLKGTEKKA